MLLNYQKSPILASICVAPGLFFAVPDTQNPFEIMGYGLEKGIKI
jgi:hypothetical protein